MRSGMPSASASARAGTAAADGAGPGGCVVRGRAWRGVGAHGGLLAGCEEGERGDAGQTEN
jgi:hypothetical protein